MRSRLSSLPLACSVLAASASFAATRPPAQAFQGLDALIEEALADQKIPGATVGVVVGDEVVLLKGYGLRDREQKLPMTPDTLMPIASVTKQFTQIPGLPFLQQVAAEISLPAFAIGGISADNLPAVLASGFQRIAVGGAVTSAEHPGQAARALLELFPA